MDFASISIINSNIGSEGVNLLSSKKYINQTHPQYTAEHQKPKTTTHKNKYQIGNAIAKVAFLLFSIIIK